MSKVLYGSLFLLGGLLAGCQPQQTVTAPSVPTRTVSHAMGTTEVPETPERVVVLDTAPLDSAIALGIQPVGTITYGTFPSYLPSQPEEIAIIGEGNQPNQEAILQLEPDLILGSKTGSSRQEYRQFSRIAPTVYTEGSGRAGDWQENFLLHAEALGQIEQAEILLADYRAQIEKVQAQLDSPETLEISVIGTYSGKVGAYTTGSFSGSVLNDIGLARTAAQDLPRRYASEISAEALDDLDGDYIFLIYSPDFSGSLQKADFAADPVWSRLEAVQQDRLCEVSGAVWAAGRSLLAAQQILQDIEACLTK